MAIAKDNNKRVIILPTMGEGSMPDSKEVIKKLTKFGFDVREVDFLSNPQDSVKSLPWNRVAAIDLRNMRGSLNNFKAYTEIVDLLSTPIAAEKRKGHSIFMTLDQETIAWVGHKSRYLEALSNKDISTIRSKVINFSNGLTDIFSDPAKVHDAANNILNHILSNGQDRFVLKPSTAALAKGLIFIDLDREGGVFTVTVPQLQKHANDNSTPMMTEYSNREDLISYLEQYLVEQQTHDRTFLLQDFVTNLETSAVYINGNPHYVTRHCGEMRVAHQHFGGFDEVVKKEDLDPNLINFIEETHASLPECVRNSPFFRIDVMRDEDHNSYTLSEIEGAGATRLWLSDSGRVEEYAQMIAQKIRNNHDMDLERKKSTHGPATKNSTNKAFSTVNVALPIKLAKFQVI